MSKQRKVISTLKAPAAIGPYVQAIREGNMLFVSGQLGINPSTGRMAEGAIEGQTVQAMNNLKAVVEAAGGDVADIIKTTILLTDLSSFSIVNNVYMSFFNGTYPARACYEVSRLPADGLIEIEAMAVLENYGD